MVLFFTLTALAIEPSTGPVNVVGGHAVEEGDWQEAVGIDYWNGQEIGCTGVLVAPNVVLTAGHCDDRIQNVILGSTDYRHPAEMIEVQQSYSLNSWWDDGDIAVLVLEEDSVFSPVVIAQDCILDDYLADGSSVTIVGYGAYDEAGEKYDSILREAVTEVTDHDCTSIGEGCLDSISPGGEIGAGGDGVDACFGDSGGPLYLNTPKGPFLVGLTSRAWDWVPWDAPCAHGGVYTRPDYFVDWIESKTGVPLPRPDCGDTPQEENLAPVPTAEPISVRSGEEADTAIASNDPDAGDLHTWTVVTAPDHGVAEVDSVGLLTYRSEEGYVGADRVVVVVTDNGTPSASGTVEIAIDVTPGESPEVPTDPGDPQNEDEVNELQLSGAGCGCASGGVGGWMLAWWGLPIVFLGRRRRGLWTQRTFDSLDGGVK